MKVKLRNYTPEDCPDMAELFYETVHGVCNADYSEEELAAWADGNVNLSEWNEKYLAKKTVVAEIYGKLAGFGNIDKNGYLDMLYVSKDFQRKGVASAICRSLEQAGDFEKVTVCASKTAKGFFEKRNYTVVKEQQVLRCGILIKNYVMELNKK